MIYRPAKDDSIQEGHRQSYCWLALAMIAGAGVRLYLLLTASVIAPDGTAYVSMARRMVFDWRGELPRDYPLGYPFLIRLAHACGGYLLSHDPVIAWQRSGQFVSLISGILVIGLLYLLGSKMIGQRCGLLAAWIWAVLPSASALSADALSDMPNLCLMLAALILLMETERSASLGSFFWAGLLSGAAYCIRPEGAEVALVGMISAFSEKRVEVGRRIAAAIAVSLGFALIGGGYAILEGGRLINKQTWLQEESAGGGDQAYDPSEPLRVSASSSVYLALFRSLGAVLEKLSLSLRYVWLLPGVVYPFLPMARRDRRWCTGPPAYLFTLHAAVLVWFHHRAGYLSHRHTMLLAVFTVILASGTLAELARMLSQRFGMKWRSSDAIIVAAIGASLSPWLLRDINSNRNYLHLAAKFVVESKFVRPPNIIAQHGWVPFYSGLLNWAACRHASQLAELPELITADLACFDTREVVPPVIHHRPTGIDVRMIEAARFTDPRGNHGMVIYRVRPGN